MRQVSNPKPHIPDPQSRVGFVVCVALAMMATAAVEAQKGWSPARTPDGQPDRVHIRSSVSPGLCGS
jgi:hypothetical protein